MENDILLDDELLREEAEKPTGKLFTSRAITTSTFLGGPLVPGYMLACNYKTLGQNHKISSAWFAAIAYTAFVYFLSFFVLSEINVPGILLNILNAFVAGQYFRSTQGEQANAHFYAGGEKETFGHAALAVLIGILVTTAPVLLYVFVFNGNF